uniref:Class I SAM-dependent methyltransferase n=1 Tax=Pectobacterium jejuense TaxID=2974022 RepID=A0ABW8H1V7_9GAMM
MIKPEPISFSETERLSQIFDAENREEWQRTSRILDKLALQPDTVIADIGAGTGYFSQLFAERVPQGKVYALDTEPNMLAYMERRFAQEAFTNIAIQPSQHGNPQLPAGLDVVFLANVYRFIRDRQAFLAQLYQQFEARTRAMFVDLKHEQAQVSPPQVVTEIEVAGFKVIEMDLASCPNHYILQFSK